MSLLNQLHQQSPYKGRSKSQQMSKSSMMMSSKLNTDDALQSLQSSFNEIMQNQKSFQSSVLPIINESTVVDDYDCLSSKVQTLDKKLLTFEYSYTTLRKEFLEKYSQNRDLVFQIKEYQEKNIDLQQQVNNNKYSSDQLQSIAELLQCDQQDIENCIQQLFWQNNQLEQEKTQQTKVIQQVQEQIKLETNQLQQQTQLGTDLIKQNECLIKQNLLLNNQISDFDEQRIQSSKVIIQFEKLKYVNELAEQEIADLKSTNEELNASNLLYKQKVNYKVESFNQSCETEEFTCSRLLQTDQSMQQFEQQQQVIQDQNQIIQDMKVKLQENQAQITSMKQKLRQLTVDKEHLQEELQINDRSMQNSQISVSDIRNDDTLQELRKQNQLQKDNIQLISSEAQQKYYLQQSEILNLEQLNKQLKSQLQEQDFNYTEKLSQSSQQIVIHSKTIQEKELIIQEKCHTMERNEKQYNEDMQQLQQKYLRLKDEIFNQELDYEKKIQFLRQEYQQNINNLSGSSKEELENLIIQNKQQNIDILQLKQLLSTKDKEILEQQADFNSKASEFEQKVNCVRIQYQSLQSIDQATIVDLQQKFNICQALNTQLNTKIQGTEKYFIKYHEIINQSINSAEDLCNQPILQINKIISQFSDDQLSLQQKISEYSDIIKQLQQRNQENELMIQQLTSQENCEKQALQQQIVSLEELFLNNTQTAEITVELEQQKREAIIAIEQLEYKIQELIQEHSLIQSQNEQQLEQSNQQIIVLQESQNQKQKQLKVLELQVFSLQESNNQLESQKQLITTHNQQISADQLDQKHQEIAILENQIKVISEGFSQERENLQNQLIQLKNQITELQVIIDQKEGIINVQTSQIHQSSSTINVLQHTTQISEKQSTLQSALVNTKSDCLAKDIEQKRQQIFKLQSDLDYIKTTIQTKNMEDLIEENLVLKQQVKDQRLIIRSHNNLNHSQSSFQLSFNEDYTNQDDDYKLKNSRLQQENLELIKQVDQQKYLIKVLNQRQVKE